MSRLAFAGVLAVRNEVWSFAGAVGPLLVRLHIFSTSLAPFLATTSWLIDVLSCIAEAALWLSVTIEISFYINTRWDVAVARQTVDTGFICSHHTILRYIR